MRETRIEVDTSAWPVVFITPRGAASDAQYLEMFRTIEGLWKREEKFLTITDTRFTSVGDARQRQLIGDWVKKNDELASKYSLGSIIILASALVRGAMTAINWIAQPRNPSIYVGSPDEAYDRARRILVVNGLDPNLVRRLHRAS